jgi:hypothetical protein
MKERKPGKPIPETTKEETKHSKDPKRTKHHLKTYERRNGDDGC